MQETIIEISCSEIRVSPFQPRREFSDEEIAELASSIQSVGLIQPPLVRKIEQNGKLLYYELLAGERRWRAVKKCGLTKIKVIVCSSDDERAAKATLIENLQRVDLNALETAEALKKLMVVFRMTQEEVADKVGKKRSTVANYLRLLSLPPTIQKSLAQGNITMGHAKAILSLEKEEEKHHLHKEILENSLNVRQSEKESQKKTLKKTAPDVHIQDLEERLSRHFQSKVSLMHTASGSGRLVIPYSNLDELDRLLEGLRIV